MTKACIVILTRNRLKMLRVCLTAVLKQIEREDLVLIINNGSIDGTAKYLIAQKIRYPKKLKYLSPKINLVYRSRNIGYEFAKKHEYDICVFIDDDCRAYPGWLRCHKDMLSRSPAIGLVGNSINSPKDSIYSILEQHLWNKWLDNNLQPNGNVNVIDTKNFSLKTSLSFEPFPSERFAEDVALSGLLLSQGYRIIYSKHPKVDHLERINIKTYLQKRIKIIKGDHSLRDIQDGDKAFHKSNSKADELKIFIRISKKLFSRRKYIDFIILVSLYLSILFIKIYFLVSNRFFKRI